MNASATTRIILTDSEAQCWRCRADFRWPASWTPKYCPACGRRNISAILASVPDQVLIENIHKECRRVELLLPIYESIVPAGKLARDILEIVLREGQQAISSGDGARMKRALESLRQVPEQ